MKTLLLLLTLSCSAAFAAGPLTRVWTDVQGRKVEATFVRLEGDTIALQTRDGAIFQFKLSNLPEAEQTVARAATPFEPPSQGGQVDKLVLKMLTAKGIKPNPPTSDEQFMRRAYLAIVGRVPTYAEAQAFLDSTSTKKRDELIDRLLETDGYTSHLYNYFADMFRVMDDANQPMQRTLPYIQWLKTQIAENRPYDKVAYDMLTASGKMWNNGATGYLLRDSGMLLDNLANTFAVFLGTNVACAQCHDHPFSEWTQKQFYELASFFGATVTNLNREQFKNGDPKARLEAELKGMAEKSGTDFAKVSNVMDDIINANRSEVRDIKENRLRLPQDYKYKDGKPGEMVKPKLIRWDGEKRGNDAYKQNTKKEEKLRQSFASWMTHPSNPRFAITIANRLWKRAFGVGIAEPVTNVDDPKSSSNPELLTYLGKEMVRLKFNLKEFQRMLYKSAAWQRASTVENVPMGVPYYFQGPVLQRMTAEQAWDSLMTLVLGSPDSYKGTDGAYYARSIDLDLEKTTAPIMAQKVSAFIKLRESEQARMGGTLADAGGTMESKKILQYGDMKLLRASELDQPAPDGHFLHEFGQSRRISMDGGNRDGSEPQVLMLMNGPVQEMLTNKESLPYRTMLSKESPGDKVESLFLTVLGRKPTTRERESAMITLKEDGEDGHANLIWALINSLEFLFVQ
jgi:hypothetical protein